MKKLIILLLWPCILNAQNIVKPPQPYYFQTWIKVKDSIQAPLYRQGDDTLATKKYVRDNAYIPDTITPLLESSHHASQTFKPKSDSTSQSTGMVFLWKLANTLKSYWLKSDTTSTLQSQAKTINQLALKLNVSDSVSAAYKLATRTQVAQAISFATTGQLQYVTAWDASGGLWPSTGVGGGSINIGDWWNISVGGTINGLVVSAGDHIYALVNNPGQTNANWDKVGSTVTVPVARIAGETGIGFIKYNGTTVSDGVFYGGNTATNNNTLRLTYNGAFYAGKFESRGDIRSYAGANQSYLNTSGIYSDGTLTIKGLSTFGSTGQATISTGGLGTFNGGIDAGTNSGSGNQIIVSNTSTGRGLSISNSNDGYGAYIGNSSISDGLYLNNSSSGRAQYINNISTGVGLYTYNSANGYGQEINNISTGTGLLLENSNTGLPLRINLSRNGLNSNKFIDFTYKDISVSYIDSLGKLHYGSDPDSAVLSYGRLKNKFITGISLTTIGSSPNANGATISGTTLNLQPASATYGGVVTTGTQTFEGEKTFNKLVHLLEPHAKVNLDSINFVSGSVQYRYYKINSPDFTVVDTVGVYVLGDSLKIRYDGDYDCVVGLNATTANANDQIGVKVYKNNAPYAGTGRFIINSQGSGGGVYTERTYYLHGLVKDDVLSFRVTNRTAARVVNVNDVSIQIIKILE